MTTHSAAFSSLALISALTLLPLAPLNAAAPEVPLPPAHRTLVAEVQRLLDADQGLKAKFWIEKSLSDEPEAADRAQLAWETFTSLRDQVAAEVVTQEIELAQIIEQVQAGWTKAGVRMLRGTGNNHLFIDLFSRHLGVPFDQAPIELDCDAAVLAVYATLEAIDQRDPAASLIENTFAVSHSDHMALAIRQGGTLRIADMNVPARTGKRTSLQWHDAERYARALEAERHERATLLGGWREILANTWELASARLIHAGRPNDALFYAQQALQITPRSLGALNNLGLAQRELGHLDAARATFLLALDTKDTEPIVHSNLASVQLLAGQLDDALESANRAIALNPGFPTAWLRRRSALAARGDGDLAREAYAEFRRLHRLRNAANQTHTARFAATAPVLAQRNP